MKRLLDVECQAIERRAAERATIPTRAMARWHASAARCCRLLREGAQDKIIFDGVERRGNMEAFRFFR